MKYTFLFLAATLMAGGLQAQRIRTEQVASHIHYLASDALQGRGTSTHDEVKAANYIANCFKASGLKPKGSKGYFFDFSFKYNKKVHDTSTQQLPLRMGRNVIGFLDNGAEKTVVIGAHYDHLGLGYDGNSTDPNSLGKIHNGADDNASGVAGVIELARFFTTNGIKEKHNFLFMTFSGEELGLLGSKKWCENPSYPLADISYMINLDMIGRLNDSTKKLLVYGIGTSDAWLPALEQVNRHFVMKYDSAGIGPSDQTSFYLKDIPVLHFFTGQHHDYHKPSDDMDKINYEGETRILELIADLIYQLDDKPSLPFYKTAAPQGGKMAFKVTLGVMPDYAFEGKGMRLDGVTDGKPASKAGLQQGDIITQLGETPI
ncbi:MAG: M20/M25/M40 family metallo-hydrolase, partial [Chitinophagaceae bacterium]|nr:M20/M25/M40 family metallo-hydrolase [Chitinophagaceae bacterium]